MISPSAITNAKEDLSRYVSRGMQVLHSRETRDAIFRMLSAKDPVRSVANVVLMVVQKVDDASRKAGLEVQDVIKLLAAMEFIRQIVEIAEVGKVFKLDQRGQNFALVAAVQEYLRGEIQAGRIDPASLKTKLADAIESATPQQKEVLQRSLGGAPPVQTNAKK